MAEEVFSFSAFLCIEIVLGVMSEIFCIFAMRKNASNFIDNSYTKHYKRWPTTKRLFFRWLE